MSEFKCSVCEYRSDRKCNVKSHIINVCKNSTLEYVKNVINCDHCKKSFTLKTNLQKHLKICKIKKNNFEEENKKLKEEFEVSISLYKDIICDINKKYNELKIKNEKNEKIIDSILKTSTKKILGNTSVETIRSQARKKYKELFKDMKCVHCKHSGSTQVCHIKAISEFDKFSEIEEINKMSNLIGLCPNCHIDLDKHKKFEVTRTAMLHSMLISY